MPLRLIEGVRDRGVRTLRLPLLNARRALRQLPFVFEQVLEEQVAPLGWRLRPGDLRTAGDGIRAETGAMFALPAKALILDGATFRFRTDQRWITCAVGLAEAVATRDQRDGLFVVHGHAEESLADVLGCRHGIRIAIRAFRIDIDQAHLHGAERLRKLAFTAVAFVSEPRPLRTPEEFFRLPNVGATAGESERLEVQRLEGNVTREDHQVGPGDLAAVLLLDRPQKPARLVEVRVVRPAIQRRKALLSRTGATAAVSDTVGSRAVPSHADHQPAVVTEVGRPPRLRGGHQGMQIFYYGFQIEALELLGIVERLAHRIGQFGIPMQDRNVQRVRPPVAVLASAGAREGAFAGALVVSFDVHLHTSRAFWLSNQSRWTPVISSNRFTLPLR